MCDEGDDDDTVYEVRAVVGGVYNRSADGDTTPKWRAEDSWERDGITVDGGSRIYDERAT